jgi:hypothetical protein
MKHPWLLRLGIGLGILGASVVAGYHYVFVARATPLDPPLTVDVGGNLKFEMDSSFLTSSRQFHGVLDRLHVDNVFYVFPGGHGLSGPNFGWNYDHKHAADSLGFVGKKFQAALTQPQ